MQYQFLILAKANISTETQKSSKIEEIFTPCEQKKPAIGQGRRMGRKERDYRGRCKSLLGNLQVFNVLNQSFYASTIFSFQRNSIRALSKLTVKPFSFKTSDTSLGSTPPRCSSNTSKSCVVVISSSGSLLVVNNLNFCKNASSKYSGTGSNIFLVSVVLMVCVGY